MPRFTDKLELARISETKGLEVPVSHGRSKSSENVEFLSDRALQLTKLYSCCNVGNS